MEELELKEQTERIEWLLEDAEDQGYLTINQILDVFPEAEEDLVQLGTLFAELHDRGVAIYDSVEEAEEAEAEADWVEDEPKEEEQEYDLSRISVDNSISLYLKEMGREPLLTREEEISLAKQIERGEEAKQALSQNGHNPDERAALDHLVQEGKAARERLIKANTRLVVSIAKKYRGQGMLSFLDLIQAGNVGLIKAADKYDYRRGTKFATYATWWIRQSIIRTLKQKGRTIRVPVHMNDRIRKLYKTQHRLEQELGRRPTPEELAETMDLDPERVRWLLKKSRRPLSLDRPVGEEEDAELGDFIEDQSTPSPVQSAEQSLLHRDLEESLQDLTPREARILRMRFGLEGNPTYTLREVGEKLGVTRERIRQIERRALRKLRHPRHSRRLRAYL